MFVFHLIDGIIEILDWDKDKIWCRGSNSASKYTISNDAWKIIFPLHMAEKLNV